MTTTTDIINAIKDKDESLTNLKTAIRKEHETMWEALEERHGTCSDEEFCQLYGAYCSAFRLANQFFMGWELKRPTAEVSKRIVELEEKIKQAKSTSWNVRAGNQTVEVTFILDRKQARNAIANHLSAFNKCAIDDELDVLAAGQGIEDAIAYGVRVGGTESEDAYRSLEPGQKQRVNDLLYEMHFSLN